MEPTTVILILALVFGLYMAWNIGANDVANAMGTSVGSGALTIRQAVVVAGIFEFSGAFLVGGHVTNTIRKGIFDPMLFGATPLLLALGMLGALLSAALWLQFASYRGLPVSTTHSIVGAVIGFSIVAMGFHSIEWSVVGSIVASWFVSPLCGGLIAYGTFRVMRRLILESETPVRATRRHAPWIVFIAGSVLGMVLFFKGLKHLKLDLSGPETALVAVSFGAICTGLILMWLRKIAPVGKAERTTQLATVEKIFGWIQVVTACFMAFAHGSNDVANAIGPLAAVVTIVREHAVAAKAPVPLWLLGLGGLGIVIGLATYGKRVIQTVGGKITEMTPTRGFAAEFGAALTILVGSRLGLPLSTTHILVGAVMGVGFAHGMAALNMRVVRGVVTSWLVTVPVAGVVSAVIFVVLRGVFGLG